MECLSRVCVLALSSDHNFRRMHREEVLYLTWGKVGSLSKVSGNLEALRVESD